ncbi:hypothetical protein [Actinoallomurus sp. CA-142502]|uniref:hypothetical protein n=1 Tax=Actinoallomurus sp. CA-142502 TaxID=3239885 RepID=UPI003D9379E3
MTKMQADNKLPGAHRHGPRRRQGRVRPPNANYIPNYALGVGRVPTKCGEVFTHTGEVLGYASTWISSGDGRRQVAIARNEYHLVQGDRSGWDTALDAYCATGQ